jgi:hypothetical protein
MAHFAEIENNIVVRVLVIDQEPSKFIQTSYNTWKGEHTLGGTPLRKNFAAIGYTYDAERDAFIPPKPYNSWVLNEITCHWDAPIPYPTDGKIYQWNEETNSWTDISEGQSTPVQEI